MRRGRAARLALLGGLALFGACAGRAIDVGGDVVGGGANANSPGGTSPGGTSPGGTAPGMPGSMPGGGPVAVDLGFRQTTDGAAGCKTACDCPAGESCRMGQCRMAPFGALYCCPGEKCPTGQVCQEPTGAIGQCGGPSGGPGGGPVMCRNVDCKSDADCAMMGCGSCRQSSGSCRNPGN